MIIVWNTKYTQNGVSYSGYGMQFNASYTTAAAAVPPVPGGGSVQIGGTIGLGMNVSNTSIYR